MMPIDREESRENGAGPPAEVTGQVPPSESQPDLAGLEKALEEEKKKAAEYLAGWQRAKADFINYKRRTEQERQDYNNFANASLILELLPALDDFERALNAIPPEFAGHEWVEGVRLVERKLRTILEGQGVKPIAALGQPFDPRYHEALRQERGKEGIVLQEIQKGYLLHDKLLRPARVVVGNGEEVTKEE